MHVDARKVEDVVVVTLDGRLVSGVGDRILHGVIDELLAEGKEKILLDLSRVSAIDSSGIGELVAGLKLAERFGAEMKLLRLGSQVRQVLSLSAMLPLFEIYHDEAEAVASFRDPAPSSAG
jgi:anti-sigma B factor antagonist